MVHLRTLTAIFLSSLVAFTTAELLKNSRKVQDTFSSLRAVLEQSTHIEVIFDEVMLEINDNTKWLQQSTADAMRVIPQGKALDEIWNVLQDTYRPGGDADQACQRLGRFAKALTDAGHRPGAVIAVEWRKEIAKAFNKLIQSHGDLMYATTKFKDHRFPEVMHQANKPLLAAYASLDP